MSDLAAAATAASLVFGAGAGSPHQILDQQFDPTSDLLPIPFNSLAIAQTFTVCASPSDCVGGQLVEVKIRIDPDDQMFALPFEIRATDAMGVPPPPSVGGCDAMGNPTYPTLACTEVDVDVNDVWITLDFWDQDLNVNPGDRLAIFHPGDSPMIGTWVGQANQVGAGYSAGSGFRENGATGDMDPIMAGQETLDFAFQTFLVPSPTTLSLLVVGLAGLAGARRAARR